jgi:hypothetical protein
MSDRLRQRGALLAAALFLLSACATHGTDPAPAAMSCPVGSANLGTAVAETLAGLDPAIFTRFRVGSPPPIHLGRYSGPLFAYATIRGSAASTGQQLGEWEAYLAQGAIGTRCALGHSNVSQVMAGSAFRFQSGPDRYLGGGAGSAAAGLVVAAQSGGWSDAAITASAARTLGTFGLRVTSIRVLRPLGPALFVRARTADPHTVEGRMDALQTALEGPQHRWRYDGLYVAIDDARGRPLFRGQFAPRAGEGGFWSAPDFDSGVAHG